MKLDRYFANPFVYRSPDGKHYGVLHPRGAVRSAGGPRVNPFSWASRRPTLTARILVGFNVGKVAKYSMDDLVPFVKKWLKERDLQQDSSFVYQRGVYTHEKAGHGVQAGEVVTEEGAQILLLNVFDKDTEGKPITESRFIRCTKKLAEAICGRLEQETVIVEISQGGSLLSTWSINNVPRGASKHLK